MPFQISFNFVKDSLVSGLSLTKPALDLLAERLDEASRFTNAGGDTTPQRPKERVSLPALIHRHGRVETAVMCMVVENVASAFLVHNHGVRGAVDRTLPLLGTRAMSTFDTAYNFLLGQAHTLVDAAARSIEDRITPSLRKTPAGAAALVSGVDRSLRLALGDDYVIDTRAYISSLPQRASSFAKVKVVKVMAITDDSRLASFLLSGVVHSSALGIFGASTFFAFTHVFTVGVEDEDTEGLATLTCDLSTDTATLSTAEDADISSDDITLDVLIEDVAVAEDKGEEGGEVMEADVEEDDDNDDEIMIIPSLLHERDVVEEVVVEAEEPEEVVVDEVVEEVAVKEVLEEVVEDREEEVVEVELVIEEEAKDFEEAEGEGEEVVVEEMMMEAEVIGEVSEQLPLELDDEMLLELAIIEQYQGSGDDDDGMGLVDEAIFCGLEEAEVEEQGLSAETLLELAIMEQYQQVSGEGDVVDVVVAGLAEEVELAEEAVLSVPLVEEGEEIQILVDPDHLKVNEGVLSLEPDETESSLLAAVSAGEAEGCLDDITTLSQTDTVAGLAVEEGEDVDCCWDSHPTEDDWEFHNGEYMTMYDELRWAGESMAGHLSYGDIKEEGNMTLYSELLQAEDELEDAATGPSGHTHHQPTRRASMPSLSLTSSMGPIEESEEKPVLARRVSFSARGSRVGAHGEVCESEMEAAALVADAPLLEEKEEERVEEVEVEVEVVEVGFGVDLSSTSAAEVGLVQRAAAGVSNVKEKYELGQDEETTPAPSVPKIIPVPTFYSLTSESKSRSTLTPFAPAFVPRLGGKPGISAIASTSSRGSFPMSPPPPPAPPLLTPAFHVPLHLAAQVQSETQTQPHPMTLPAHWTPAARGVSVTISAPRERQKGGGDGQKGSGEGKAKGGKPSRRERHLARMGAGAAVGPKKGKGKEKEKEKGVGEGKARGKAGQGVLADRDLNVRST